VHKDGDRRERDRDGNLLQDHNVTEGRENIDHKADNSWWVVMSAMVVTAPPAANFNAICPPMPRRMAAGRKTSR
jgi:hypothetical protein